MMIQLRNLNKTISRKKILNNLNLDLNGVTGILGPNGAGKSTLMQIIASVEKGDRGSEVAFKTTFKEPTRIGYVPQNFFVYPNLTVQDTLRLLSSLKGFSTLQGIQNLLDKFNLNDYGLVKMKDLSGGVRRRVAIAQALINDPHYLIIDEPTAGLDISECINIRKLLLDISKNTDIIISSHNTEDIELICNHVVVIESGNILYNGTIKDIVDQAKLTPYQTYCTHKELSAVSEAATIIKTLYAGDDFYEVAYLINDNLPLNLSHKSLAKTFTTGYLSLINQEVIY